MDFYIFVKEGKNRGLRTAIGARSVRVWGKRGAERRGTRLRGEGGELAFGEEAEGFEVGGAGEEVKELEGVDSVEVLETGEVAG